MSSEIKNIHEAKAPEFIGQLKELLQQAKEGKIKGCLCYYMDADSGTWICHGWNVFEALAALRRLEHIMNTEWDE